VEFNERIIIIIII